MESFGNIIKNAREKLGLLLRHVAAQMDIDQALISKYERGDRIPNKEQVIKLSKILNLPKEQLITAWLSDRILYEIGDEKNALEALQVAEKKIEYFKLKSNKK